MKKSWSQEEETPKKRTHYTVKLTEAQIEKLRAWCSQRGWAAYPVDYAHFGYKGDQVNVVAYKSGKVMIQGKKTEDFVTFVIEQEVTGDPRLGYDNVHHPEWFEPHGGLDESGKGDFFGPLVSACVIADGTMAQDWMEAGIRDSKRLTSDRSVMELERIIRKTRGVVVRTTFAGMKRYNELYPKFQSNLNRLLAWMHANALKEALKQKTVPWVMLDQFTKQPLVQSYFDNDPVDVRMQTKAEADPVVAAASIVARAEYIRQMKKLSDRFGEPLQRGANAKVKQQARTIIDRWGPEVLQEFAKMHFRTAREVLQQGLF